MSSEPHFVVAPNEYKLNSGPTDGISAVKFTPQSSQFLLVSSWDCQVRLFDVSSNVVRLSYHHSAPVLDCDFQENHRAISGGIDTFVKSFDMNTNSEFVLGQHTAPVRCVEFNAEMNTIVTGSWDNTVKLWDGRSSAKCNGSFPQPDKVYSMSSCGHRLIVGTAGRKVLIWDLRQMGQPEQKRDSSLKYQTRCLKAFPNRQGFVLSSIEGRVAVEFIDPHPDQQKKKYAFKCHRSKDEVTGAELIYPVNTIAFHPGHQTFATGGSDGFVNIWDPKNKKRLCQLHRYPSTISALSFSPDGSLLAIASSYQYELESDPNPLPEDVIFIRKLSDAETKPKA